LPPKIFARHTVKRREKAERGDAICRLLKIFKKHSNETALSFVYLLKGIQQTSGGNKKKNESPRTGDMTEEKEAELKPVFDE